MEHNAVAPAAQDAVRTALARLLPHLRVFARFLAGTVADADDLLQEALIRVLRAHEDGRLPVTLDATDLGLRPWCLGVIRNVYHEQIRRRRREAAHRLAEVDRSEAAPAPQERQGEMRDLAIGLASLPPLLREALVLVGAEGLSLEEAAAVCSVPVGTMKARVSRARRQLALAMGIALT